MSVFTVNLEESIGMSDIDKPPLIEDMKISNDINGGLSDAHITLSESLTVLESVALNWTNSNTVTVNAGEYLFMSEAVTAYKLGVIYDKYLTEAMSVLERLAKITNININDQLDMSTKLVDGGRSLLEKAIMACYVTANSGISLSEVFSINESLIRNIIANRSMITQAEMEVFIAGYIVHYGEIDLITCAEPIKDFIYMELYTDALVNVTLKLPEFGDDHTLQTSIIHSEDIYIQRELSDDKITMSFTTVKSKTEIIDFYNASRGKRIKFIDQYDNTFLGYLTSPNLSINEETIKLDTCGDYSTKIVFEGKRITDGEL